MPKISDPELKPLPARNRLPKVSCLLPIKGGTASDVHDAIRRFESQTYPNKELIVVHSADQAYDESSPGGVGSAIRDCRVERAEFLGDLLDAGCEQARGAIIAHWHTDHDHPPHHIHRLVQPLLERVAHLSLLDRIESRESAHSKNGSLHNPDWATLTYWKVVWEKLLRHPRGPLDTEKLFFLGARRLGSAYVSLAIPPAASGGASSGNPRPHDSPATPLISCLMPTYGRPHFARRSIHYFLQQDYPNKELIILDDSSRPDEEMLKVAAGSGAVTYLYLHGRYSLGFKRELACDLARGSLLALWDDDDWYGDQRLSEQAQPIIDGRAEISLFTFGLVFFVDRQQVLYNTSPGWIPLADGTMMFGRDLHRRIGGFRNIVFPDTVFLSSARKLRTPIVSVANSRQFLYLRHGRNLWSMPFACLGPQPREIDLAALLPEQDLDFYRNLASSASH